MFSPFNSTTIFNISSDENLKTIARTFTIITIILTCLTILLDTTIIFHLISYIKFTRRYSKCTSRRIGLLHSINTYIHIIGETSIFLLMSIRTLYGDLHIVDKKEFSPSWHCRLLNVLMSMFASGIYGSCFLQSLFRFWRIMKPEERLYRKISFHFRLIYFHWILILIFSIPVWFRSVYLSKENFCLNHFTDTYSSIYISITSVCIPVLSIIYIYFRIVLYMKHNWQSRKRWRRMKKDISTIKRIILLIFVLLNVSGAAIILWLLMFIQKRLHPLSYRLLCFIIAISMFICSITLLIVSPQLKRTLRITNSYNREQYLNEKKINRSANLEQILQLEDKSCF